MISQDPPNQFNRKKLDEFRQDPDFQYTKLKPNAPEPSPLPTIPTVAWIVMAAVLIGYVIVRMSGISTRSLLSRGGMKLGLTVDDADIDPMIKLKQDIEAAEQQEDYLQALRLRFRMMLLQLAERKWITYQHEKTNYQYAIELSGKPVRNEYRHVARLFDYYIYGGFPLNFDAYKVMRHRIANLMREARESA